MGAFLQQAEGILDVATAGQAESGDLVIVLDREGGIRMLDPTGWSVPALQAEFGAASMFKVEHRGRTVRVEGWQREQRCLLERRIQTRIPGILI